MFAITEIRTNRNYNRWVSWKSQNLALLKWLYGGISIQDHTNREQESHNSRKRNFWHVRPANIQISLRIREVWSESSLGAFWIAKDALFCVCTTKTRISLRKCAGWFKSSFSLHVRRYVVSRCGSKWWSIGTATITDCYLSPIQREGWTNRQGYLHVYV